MDYNKRQKLLQKYYNGKTTLEEEKSLKKLNFNHLELDKMHFDFLKEQKLNDKINIVIPKQKKTKKYYYIAACVTILTVFGLIFYTHNEYQKAEKYLELYSQTFEKANQHTEKTDKFINIIKDLSHE